MDYVKYKRNLNRTSTNTFKEFGRISKNIPRNLSQKRCRNSSNGKRNLLMKQKSSSPFIREKRKSSHSRKTKSKPLSILKENKSIKKILSINRFLREKASLGQQDFEKKKRKSNRLSLRKMVRREKSFERRGSCNREDLPYTMIRKLGKGSYAYVYLGIFFILN